MNHNAKAEAFLQAEDRAAHQQSRHQPVRPFSIRNLSVLAYANGFTHWHYRCDKICAVLTANYFGSSYDMLTVGDHISVSAGDGGALLLVRHAEPETVHVAPMAMVTA